MEIREASEKEMLSLWGFANYEESSPTAKFFAESILSGNTSFWTIDHGGSLIGELYAFKNLNDKDYADGQTRAYLCAFRIRQDYRGKGLGSQLMQAVFTYLKACGFQCVTIGVDETEEANIRLYERLGFNTKIKDCYIDPCDMDDEMKPKACSCYWLLSRNLI